MALPAAAPTMVVVLVAVLAAVCLGEFTVVVPDSSSSSSSAAALVNAPQTGLSDRARTDPAEQRAVQEVMAATGNGWASGIADVCRGRWHGIECVPDRGEVYHVVSLSFGALSDDTAFPACDAARATLSQAVLALPHLRSLFFYRCFTANPQPVPAFLGRLGPAFRSLVLRENGHVGAIPPELGNLTALRVLDLHGNHLTSAIPATIQSLEHLQLLDLSYNQLAGEVPHFKFQHLSILDLSHNALQGRVPATLGQCRSLLKMDLSQNRLAGTIPDALGDLPDLILLDLSQNSLSGPIPAALGRLSSLRSLILGDNRMQFSTVPDGFFAGLKALTTLVLSGMGLEGSVPESIGELDHLRVLRLDNNEFTGVIPASFRRLERASELRVDGNRLVGPIPFGKEMMWRLGKKLRVGGNEGLCYDAKQQGLEGVVALAGVSDCDSVRSRTTQHLANTGGWPAPVANVTASAASGRTGACVWSWHVFVGVLVSMQLVWL
ncbi:protein TOO MANY MOUTHS [Oryza brachyantha]|uniref:Leucine-rich repeat-containing N-terminal plant-type domain-containing protein n=1 Tax=Oryza brachyantha TaxID=4533 RepID=J3L207_ORYBR|nr:protein TOO MANY MOUTHS [Oryza brachyantha]